jgi:hypothetical protein
VQRKFWNLPTKTTQTVFCSAAAKNLGIYQQKQLKFVLPRSQKLWNATKHCNRFSRAAKILEFTNRSNSNLIYFLSQRKSLELKLTAQRKQLKLTAVCSNVQPKILELRTSTVFGPAAQRKFFELRTKSTALISAAQRTIWNLPAEATQINCILFCRVAKNFGICQQKQLKSTATILKLRPKALYFGLPRSEIFWNCEQKSTAFCSAAQGKF